MVNIEQKFREACKQSGLSSMLNQLNNQALNGLISATMNLLRQSATGNSIVGTIKSIGVTTNVAKAGKTPFDKRDLILDCSRYNPDDGTKIENYVQLNFTQNNCALLDSFAIGQKVEVKFRVSGREWQDKIINDITGIAIERVDGGETQPVASIVSSTATPQAAPAPAVNATQTQDEKQNSGGSNDLPF